MISNIWELYDLCMDAVEIPCEEELGDDPSLEEEEILREAAIRGYEEQGGY